MITWSAPPVPPLALRGAARTPIRVFDSTSQTWCEVAPGPTARLYVCGITPYDATHLGHANTFLVFDVLHRLWLAAGKRVQYASNVTDVDDPLLARAAETEVPWDELAAGQIELFRRDLAALRILPPTSLTGAVEAIPRVARAVEDLLGAAAYRVGDSGSDIYADLSADSAFGSVARLNPATMIQRFAEHDGDPDTPGKRHPLDPLLWRMARAGEPAWDSPLGAGRPGWHIECAVIARDALGLAVQHTFDVQGGGSDLLFPHHEMSASHLRMLCGDRATPRVQVHCGLLGYQGEKMSKSLGNLVFVGELLAAGVDPMAIRLALLNHHYRTAWEWTEADLASAEHRLAAWRTAARRAGTNQALSPAGQTNQPNRLAAALFATLALDLAAPAALNLVDQWAKGPGLGSAAQVAIDALLGISLKESAD